MVIRGCPTSQGGQPGFPISTLPYTLSIIYTEYNIQCIWKAILYTHQPILTLPSLLHNRVAFKLPTHFANLHIPDQAPRLKTNLPKQTALPFFLRFSPVHPLTAQHMIAGRGKRGKKPEKNRSHDSNARKQRSSPKGPTGPEQAEG